MEVLFICGIVTIGVGIGLIYFGWNFLMCADIMDFTPLLHICMIVLGFLLIAAGWEILPFDMQVNMKLN